MNSPPSPTWWLGFINNKTTARALYGAGDKSDVHTFTVRMQLMVTSIKDSGGKEIPNGTHTRDTNITISGLGGYAEQQLAVVKFGGDVIGNVRTDANSAWPLTYTFTPTNQQQQVVWCQSQSQISNGRRFTVNE
jgi:hypothetical protein